MCPSLPLSVTEFTLWINIWSSSHVICYLLYLCTSVKWNYFLKDLWIWQCMYSLEMCYCHTCHVANYGNAQCSFWSISKFPFRVQSIHLYKNVILYPLLLYVIFSASLFKMTVTSTIRNASYYFWGTSSVLLYNAISGTRWYLLKFNPLKRYASEWYQ